MCIRDRPGSYIYSLSNSCGTFTSEVVVTVTQAPDAGADSTLITCVVDNPTDLFGLLGNSAQTGGTLLDSTVDLVDGQMYYASQTDPTSACESAIRIGVMVIIYQSPNAGAAVPLAVCENDNNVDLFNALDGTHDAGGAWQNNDGVGSLTGNVFDATGVTPGSYQFTYLVTASPPCVDAQVIITLEVEEPLNPGS